MNVGQILETHLGWSCTELGEKLNQLVNENQKKIEKTEKIKSFLKNVYGKEIYDEDIEKLNQSEFEDLCSNIRHGVFQ